MYRYFLIEYKISNRKRCCRLRSADHSSIRSSRFYQREPAENAMNDLFSRIRAATVEATRTITCSGRTQEGTTRHKIERNREARRIIQWLRSRFSMAAYHETREQRRTRGMSHGCSLFPLFPPCGEVAKKEKGSASSNTKDREQPEDEEGGKETRRLALTISRLRFAYAWPARRPEVRPRKRR